MKPYSLNLRSLLLFTLALFAFARAASAQEAEPTRHTEMVSALAFSPDDRSLFVTRGHEVIQRNAVDGFTLKTFRGHVAAVTSLAVSGDGKTLITSGADGSVKLWGVETGRVNAEPSKGTPGKDVNHDVQVNAVALSPDGRIAAWGDNAGDLTLWDVSEGKRLRTLREEPRAAFKCVAFSPRGDTLFTGSVGGNVVRWDVATGRKVAAFVDGPGHGVHSMSVSPDGGKVLTLTGMNIRLWDSAKGKELLAFGYADEGYTPRCVTFTPDGKNAIWGDDRRVFVWDLKKDLMPKAFIGPPFGRVESVAVSHGGEFVAAGDIFGNVRVWRYATGESLWPDERRDVQTEAGRA